jgi:hypothetical protein
MPAFETRQQSLRADRLGWHAVRRIAHRQLVGRVDL